MKIEVGKRYENGRGEVCKVIYKMENDSFDPFVVIVKRENNEEACQFLTENGCFRNDGIVSYFDLIKEIPDED